MNGAIYVYLFHNLSQIQEYRNQKYRTKFSDLGVILLGRIYFIRYNQNVDDCLIGKY